MNKEHVDFGLGVTRHWEQDGTVVVYTVRKIRRDAFDLYMEAVTQVVSNWEPDALMLSIHDFSDIAWVPPYAQQRGIDLVKRAKHLTNKNTAFVLKDNFVGNLSRAFIGTQIQRWLDHTRIFTDIEEAREWLEVRREMSQMQMDDAS